MKDTLKDLCEANARILCGIMLQTGMDDLEICMEVKGLGEHDGKYFVLTLERVEPTDEIDHEEEEED